ncbi:PQQ-binding-like beta-propeller repeat protein [Actinomadura sp. BRA 177]|uniref:PQQ-binding-like beta-propeller repeat protein n=1 Tax=Actinomadura sp. BRA 177 TaxID=2745202 RepID=UPI001C3E5E3C|nr:PQQ-binding-like beta-propeller repeat protein [Actinomadura sp. BRA 177]
MGKLRLKWAFGFPKMAGPPHSQPAVVGRTVYFGGPDGRFRALDARTGAPKCATPRPAPACGAAPRSTP